MKFQVGDRIRVYDVCQMTNIVTSDKGMIEFIGEDGILLVRMDNWGTKPSNVFYFHSKQCRKLIKKIKFPSEWILQPITRERYRQMKLKLKRRWKKVDELEKDLTTIITCLKELIELGKNPTESKECFMQDLEKFYKSWKKYL